MSRPVILVPLAVHVSDMMLMLWEGMRQRAVGAHNLNKDSSRSQSMLTFYLESEEMIDDEPCVKFGKIAFVDLAGTERLKDTQNGEVSWRHACALRRQCHREAWNVLRAMLTVSTAWLSARSFAEAIHLNSVQVKSRNEV